MIFNINPLRKSVQRSIITNKQEKRGRDERQIDKKGRKDSYFIKRAGKKEETHTRSRQFNQASRQEKGWHICDRELEAYYHADNADDTFRWCVGPA